MPVQERDHQSPQALRRPRDLLLPPAHLSTRALPAGLAQESADIPDNRSCPQNDLPTRWHPLTISKIVRSLPGLATVLGARVLAEFGDDPNRYDSAKSRKNYAGTSPITRSSGKLKIALARYARNRRLANACQQWAFAAIKASPGARAFYDTHRSNGDTHNQALRALANRLVGILHGCLRHQTLYDEHTAWSHRLDQAA